MRKPDYITSDVHLGAIPEARERSFVRFLAHAGDEASRLLIPGDLFDFWFEYGEVIPGRHFRVLAALRDVVDAGVPVAVLGGNHDAWGGRFLEEHVGVSFHPGQVRTEIAGLPALLAHGDGLGRGDLKYRALKAMLRGRLTIAAFRALHPELGMRIAQRVSSTVLPCAERTPYRLSLLRVAPGRAQPRPGRSELVVAHWGVERGCRQDGVGDP